MKVCETCGAEIDTRDGENECQYCAVFEKSTRNAAIAKVRREREQAMRDCGLVKVRGALGGTYWE